MRNTILRRTTSITLFLVALCLCSVAWGQTVSLTNLSNHGSNDDLFVGDGWQITLTGTPGAAIAINSVDTGDTIDANGQKIYSGTIQSGSEGMNYQYWTVGGAGASPYPLQFKVEPAPTNSCAAAAYIWASPDTMYTTDTLHRIFLWTSWVSRPGSLHVIAETDPAPPTCELNQYGTAPGGWDDYLYAQSIMITGQKAEFYIYDKGCTYTPGVVRTCEWYVPNDWPNPSRYYPAFSELYVWAAYYDRYDHQYTNVSMYVYVWVDQDYQDN